MKTLYVLACLLAIVTPLQASSSSSGSHEIRYFGQHRRPAARPLYPYYPNAYYPNAYYPHPYPLTNAGLCWWLVWPHNTFICTPPQPVQIATAAPAQTSMATQARTSTVAQAQTSTVAQAQTTAAAPEAVPTPPVPTPSVPPGRGDH